MSVALLAPKAGHVIQWLKGPGDWVQAGEPVVLVAHGATAQSLPAPQGGMLTARLCEPGAAVEPDAMLAYIDTAVPLPSGDRLIPWSELRMRIAQHMQYSNNTSAHITTGVEVDMTNLEALRRHLKQQGLPMGLTPFFVRAAAEALPDWPVLNGQVLPGGLLIPPFINIGVAVARL